MNKEYEIVDTTNQSQVKTEDANIQKPGNRRIALAPVGKPRWSILGIGEHWQCSINSFTDWYWDRPNYRGSANKNNLKLCYYQICCIDNNKTSCNPWVRTCCTHICCGNDNCGLAMSLPLFCSCLCITACLCGGHDTPYPVGGRHGICECCCAICPLDYVRATCHTPCLHCSRCLYTICCCPSSQPVHSISNYIL